MFTFGNQSYFIIAAFIKQRAEGLNDFGAQIFENDKLKNSKEVQRFFGIDKQVVGDGSVGFNTEEGGPDVDDGINLGMSHNARSVTRII